jgi:colanic acid biosynthesis glycosyl transferase WcaI
MHILFFADNFPPERNAAATRVYERACYWVKWGHQVTVVTCAPNFPEGKLFDGYKNKWHQIEDMDGIRVVRVKTFIRPNAGNFFRILDFTSYMTTAFVASLFQKKIDIVVATSPQFFAAVGGYMSAVCKRKPFVFELGDLWPASVKALGVIKDSFLLRMCEKLELFLYRRSAKVVALTNAFKKDLVSRGIQADKIKVIINGVDLKRYAPRERDEVLAKQFGLDNKFVIGYVGTHGMAHGLINVLDTAELLRDKADIRFILVGPGAERQKLIEEAKKRKLENVVFIPSQPKESMPKIWSLCNVALVHLKNDPIFNTVIPSKIFEAMGMGLPILLVAPKGEASDIIEKDEAGVWVPAGDPKAFADVVMDLYENREKLQKLAQNSHAAAPLHSRERQAKEVIDLLGSVVS